MLSDGKQKAGLFSLSECYMGGWKNVCLFMVGLGAEIVEQCCSECSSHTALGKIKDEEGKIRVYSSCQPKYAVQSEICHCFQILI